MAAVLMQGICEAGWIDCGEKTDWSVWFEKLTSGKISGENLAREYLLTGFYLLNGMSWEPEPDYQRAVYYLQKSRDLMPKNPDVYPLLAVSYWNMGKGEAARLSLETLKNMAPERYSKTLAEYPYLTSEAGSSPRKL